MANTTLERGACTAPFLQLSKFDGTAGCKVSILEITILNIAKTSTDLSGRFCTPVPTAQGTVQCCLPCPITDWVYSDGEWYTSTLLLRYRLLKMFLDFDTIPKAANWLNVAGMVCSMSILITYLILPVSKTSRHYLTVGLVVAVCLMQV